MKEPVQVAHGRYGCKSAYETYKRFARTNTRLGVWPRRWEETMNKNEQEKRTREEREEEGELGLRWIQMRINIYKRVRRWSSLLDSYLEPRCGRCEEILVLAQPREMRNGRRKTERRERKKRTEEEEQNRETRVEYPRQSRLDQINLAWNLVDDKYLVDFHILIVSITLKETHVISRSSFKRS